MFYILRDVSEFENQWFDDAESVRESVGILEMSLDQHSDDKEVINDLRIQMFLFYTIFLVRF